MRHIFEKKHAILLLAAIIVVLFVAIAALSGWQVDTVLSGSMEPAIPVGGVVVICPVSPDEVQAGDVITFRSGGYLVTHRVTAVVEGSPTRFVTRGDANEDVDAVQVEAEDVVGRVCCTLPFLGYLAAFVRTPAGIILTLLVPGVILIALEVQDIMKTRDGKGG